MKIVVYNSSMIMYVNWITVPVAALECSMEAKYVNCTPMTPESAKNSIDMTLLGFDHMVKALLSLFTAAMTSSTAPDINCLIMESCVAFTSDDWNTYCPRTPLMPHMIPHDRTSMIPNLCEWLICFSDITPPLLLLKVTSFYHRYF